MTYQPRTLDTRVLAATSPGVALSALQFLDVCHTGVQPVMIDGLPVEWRGEHGYIEWDADMQIALPEYLRIMGHIG